MGFTAMLSSVFSLKFMLVPFSVQRVETRVFGGTIGYSNYRIFGFQILKIQETKPWE